VSAASGNMSAKALAGNLLSGKNCIFQDKVVDGDLDLHEEIPCKVDLKGVVFLGRLNLTDATFAKGLSIRRSLFQKHVDMRRIRVKKSFNVSDSFFTSSAEFTDGEFGDSFSIRGSTFGSTLPIKFDGMTVAQSILMGNVQFNGPVDFIHVTAERNFHAEDIKVAAGPTKFNRLRIRDDVFLQRSIFTGSGKVEFQGMAIGGDLKLNGAHFENKAGMTTFAGTRVTGKLHMARVAFGALDLSGVSYGSITAADEEAPNGDDKWGDLLEYVANAKFSGDAFKSLENYFKTAGYPERADEVYIRFKKEQRNTLAFPSLSWFYNWLSWASVKFDFAFPILLLFFWVLGTIHFKSSPMDTKKDEAVGEFSPAFYTLELLLPLSNLHATSGRTPRNRRGLLWMRSLKILGWVLVPLSFASLTRIFR